MGTWQKENPCKHTEMWEAPAKQSVGIHSTHRSRSTWGLINIIKSKVPFKKMYTWNNISYILAPSKGFKLQDVYFYKIQKTCTNWEHVWITRSMVRYDVQKKKKKITI